MKNIAKIIIALLINIILIFVAVIYYFIDKVRVYFFSKKCQEEIDESEEAFKKGKYSTYTSGKDLKKDLEK